MISGPSKIKEVKIAWNFVLETESYKIDENLVEDIYHHIFETLKLNQNKVNYFQA